MSIFEKAAQRIAKVASKADSPRAEDRPQRTPARRRGKQVLGFDESELTERLKEMGIFGSELQLRRTADEYRRIKRPLLANAFKPGIAVEDGQTILVTSSLQGEGKTYTSINLAMSMARERDMEVVLIDADIFKRNVSRIFGVEDSPGLFDILVGDKGHIDDCLLDVDIPNFRLLPVGCERDDSTELLASDRMREVLEELRGMGENQIVILDSPPVLMTAETQVLKACAGQIVFVVEAVRTAKSAVLQAISELNTDKPVNMILNKSRRSLGINYYGDYYGSSSY